MNKHKILYKLIAMFIIVILLNAININTTKAITMNAYPMTDSNFNIWGDSVQTTYSDKGYFSVLTQPLMEVVSIPVILTGGITDISAAEELLVQKKADLIGVGRAIYKDSSWAKKAMSDIS